MLSVDRTSPTHQRETRVPPRRGIAGRVRSEAAGEAAPLGTSQAEFPESATRTDPAWRRLRFQRRQASAEWLIRAAREEAGLPGYAENITSTNPDWVRPPRPARCRWRIGNVVGVHGDRDGAHFSGIERCASIWACPVCVSVIRAERAHEIQRAVDTWQDNGGSLAFATMTLRHKRQDPLNLTLEAVIEGWRRLLQGRWWAGESERDYAKRLANWQKKLAYPLARRKNERSETYARRVQDRQVKLLAKRPQRAIGFKERHGIEGYVRTIEVTVGANGWHPHVHALFFTREELSSTTEKNWQRELFDQWAKIVTDLGARMPSEEHGVIVKAADRSGKVLAQYLCKFQDTAKPAITRAKVANELARLDYKQGRGGSRMPFELLDADITSETDYQLWVEYYEATWGRRAITWSHGLRDQLLPDEEEKTDEEILDEVETREIRFTIDGRTWDHLKHQPDILALTLEAVEREDIPTAMGLSGGFELEPGLAYDGGGHLVGALVQPDTS